MTVTNISDAAAQSVKLSTTGGRKAPGASWAWADLTHLIGNYVKAKAETESCYIGAVPDASTEPEEGATTDFTEAYTAELLAAGESVQFVVQKDTPYVAYLQGSGAGLLHISKV